MSPIRIDPKRSAGTDDLKVEPKQALKYEENEHTVQTELQECTCIATCMHSRTPAFMQSSIHYCAYPHHHRYTPRQAPRTMHLHCNSHASPYTCVHAIRHSLLRASASSHIYAQERATMHLHCNSHASPRIRVHAIGHIILRASASSPQTHAQECAEQWRKMAANQARPAPLNVCE